jgi:hypothetical protein
LAAGRTATFVDQWGWRGRSGGPESCVYSIKQAAREEADHGGILHRPPNEFQMRLACAAR